jgi:hypothetical protein
MNLAGSTVSFHLLPQGREALQGIVPGKDVLEGFVVQEDHLGVWLSLPELKSPKEVVLLKWEQFSTAILEYEPKAPAQRSPVGFGH